MVTHPGVNNNCGGGKGGPSRKCKLHRRPGHFWRVQDYDIPDYGIPGPEYGGVGMSGGCRGRSETRSGARAGRNRGGDDGRAKPLTIRLLCTPRATCDIIEQPMKHPCHRDDADLVEYTRVSGPGMEHPGPARRGSHRVYQSSCDWALRDADFIEYTSPPVAGSCATRIS